MKTDGGNWRAGPYQGLVPFAEEDSAFFFAREMEREKLIAHLMSSRLTLLYGSTGVGKTSLLLAGVVPELRRITRLHRERLGTPGHAVVIFQSWRDDPLRGLAEAVGTAVAETLEREEPSPPPAPFTEALAVWAGEILRGRLLIILDQFEEYFLYHPDDRGPGSFAQEFSRAVTAPGLAVNFLISIREDSFARLDKFKGRIPRLFERYMRLEHLERKAAEDAIRKPVAELNRRHGTRIELSDPLVEAVLDQLPGVLSPVDDAGEGVVAERASVGGARIETPYLQMVMARLWDEEVCSWESSEMSGPMRLRPETLKGLGEVIGIVRTHVDAILETLETAEKDLAARIFNHLVTPSGTKIAQTAADLAAYSKLPPEQVGALLDKLVRKVRILRPLPAPPDKPEGDRYEIFHDVLATPILDWRRRFVRELERHEAERELERKRRETELKLELKLERLQNRTRRWQLAGALLATLLLALAVVAFLLVRDAERQRRALANGLAHQAELTRERQGDLLGQSVLLAIASLRLEPSLRADQTLRSGLALLPAPATPELTHGGIVRAVDLSRDGSLVATASQDTFARLWRISDPDEPQELPHDGVITSVDLSPDDRYLATASVDGTVRVIAVDSGREIHRIRHEDAVVMARFSPEGRYLATASRDRTAALWEVGSSEAARRLPHGGPVTAVAFDPGEARLATASAEGSVRLWETASGAQTADLPHGEAVSAVAFSADGTRIATASQYTVRVWDVDGQEVAEWEHSDPILGLAASPAGTYYATASQDGSVRLWDFSRPERELQTWRHDGPVSALVFSPDGQFLASASHDKTARIWHLPSGREALRMVHRSLVTALAFDGEGRFLATASHDRTARVWYSAASAKSTVFYHPNYVEDLAFDPEGRFLATACLDFKLRFWPLRAEEPGKSPSPEPIEHASAPTAVAFSRKGAFFATGSRAGAVRLWRRSEGAGPMTLLDGAESIEDLVFDDTENRLAASSGGFVRVWDVDQGEVLLQLYQDAPVRGIAFSPDGDILATADEDGNLHLWNAADGRERLRLRYAFALTAVAFSHGGEYLAVAGADGIHLWQGTAQWGRRASEKIFEDKEVNDLTFSSDGTFMASAGRSGAVLWNVTTGETVARLSQFDEARAVAFSPDDKYLATAGHDFTARLWYVRREDAIDDACRRSIRALTPEEWTESFGEEPYRPVCP